LKAVDLIVLNWKDESGTLECLEAIRRLRGAYQKQIIVVDNEGTSESRAALEAYPDHLTIVTNEHNLGFSGGVNSALPHLKGDYVALINNDCLVDPGWLEAGLAAFEAEDELGIIGGREYLWDDDNPAYDQTNRYTKLPIINPRTAEVDHSIDARARRTDLVFITASNLLMRTELMKRLGGFDSAFFTYYEDVDLCARVIDQGYRVGFDPTMMAWHKGNQTSNRMPYAKIFYSRRNRCLIIAKHFNGNWRRRVVKIAWDELTSSGRLLARQARSRSDSTMARAGITASRWLLTHLPRLASIRRHYRQHLTGPPRYYDRLIAFYRSETSS
jgi:GT2 family glycosyltransferase